MGNKPQTCTCDGKEQPTTKEEVQNTTTPSAAEGALEIPKNIDIRFTSNINAVIFDQLTIQNIKGEITLAKAIANLTNLKMQKLKEFSLHL